MDKTKAIISSHEDSHMEFKYYFSVIQIAEESINENPDVTIDCCKSLIEGVSKSILIRLDNNYNKNNKLVDGVKAINLFNKAIRVISNFDNSLIGKETDFLGKSHDLVETIIKIRNDRGDISHGKFTPKPSKIISTSEFALFILNMTDSVLSFMLKIFFAIEIPSTGVLDFDSKKMEPYNTWLDESVDFPIKRARYSKLLYENDYDEYENRYRNEFGQDIEEEVKEVVSRIIDSLFISATKREFKGEKKIPVETKKEAVVIPAEKEKAAEPEKKIIEKLVSDFDEETFWSEVRNEALQEFAETENLKSEELKEVVNDYLFSEKPPLRDDVAKTMNERPKLSEFKTVVPVLTERILAFAKDLKN